MKRTIGFLLCSFAFGLFALGSVDCGSDSSNGGGGSTGSGNTSSTTSGKTSSTSGKTTGATTSSGAGGGSGGSGGGSSVTLDCKSYCDEVQADCTGANQQYSDDTMCSKVCATFPKGALNDMAGDTLGCRLYHGGAPAQMDPSLHCPHAGPSGGDGVCGDACTEYCALEMATCASNYASMGECMTACAGIPKSTAPYTVVDASGNEMGTFNCYLYHLTAATENAALHCPHSKPGTSMPCDPVAGP